MKKLFSNFIVLVLISCTVLISCSSLGGVSQEMQEKYPLTDYVKVFESNRSQKDLFTDVRSCLVDRYTGKTKYNWDELFIITDDVEKGKSLTNVITFKVFYYFSGMYGISFVLSVEFKNNKMRLGLRNIVLNDANWPQTHTEGLGGLKLRKAGYAEYQKNINALTSDFSKIAEGIDKSW